MEAKIEQDVQKVLEFMVQNIPADKLVAVAQGVNALAAPLWGRHGQGSLVPLELNPVMHVLGR